MIYLGLLTRSSFIIALFAVTLFGLAAPCPAKANPVLHSQMAVEFELRAYESLTKIPLFQGKLHKGDKREIDTSYRGLALLLFSEGRSYPVIIGDKSFTVIISSPAEPPSFANSAENDFLYKALTANTQIPDQFPFAVLIIQAKNLLDSSHSIRTTEELKARKKEFCRFIAANYHSLKHSDLIRRFIAQYFMMHEYVDYHVAGAPPTDIKKKYQQEILAGVGDWLKILAPHIPEQEIVNYCVSLYYNRSMVTLASVIIDKFKDAAYCPGDTASTFSFPGDLQILETGQNTTKNLDTIKGNKLIAFFSEQCPVSMVAAVKKARKLADAKPPITLIITPLEKLSGNHLSMNRMVRNGKLLFVSDEKWRKNNLTKGIKLPLFINIEDGLK